MSNKKKPFKMTGATARKLYRTMPELKEALEESYGKEFFQQDLTKVINNFEDVLEVTGRPDVPAFSDLPEDLRDHFQKYYRVIAIVEAFNQGEKMNIYDKNVSRYYPYFRTNGSPSGFAFGGSCYGDASATAGSGSRLSLRESKYSDYMGKNFKQIIQEYLES